MAVISWRLVLLGEEIGLLGENHRPERDSNTGILLECR
jgi:hypothetical protein